MYAIIKDGVFIPAPRRITLGEWTVINPTDEQYEAAGTYWGWTTANKWEMGGTSITDVDASDSQFDIVKFEWYAKNSGKLTVNDTVLTQRAGSSSGGYTKYNIFGTGTYSMSCRQKEIAVYGVAGGTTETAHPVPCYRKADGVIGMYDIVNDEFLVNIGTGTFSKGPDVNSGMKIYAE